MKSATIVLFAVVGFVALLSLATAAPEPDPENAAPAVAKPKKNSWMSAEDKKKLSKLSKQEKEKFTSEKRDAHLATLSEAAKATFLAEEDQAVAPSMKFSRWLTADKKNDMSKMTKEEKGAFVGKKMEEYKATLNAADKAAFEAESAKKADSEAGKAKLKGKRPQMKLLNKN